MLVTYNAQELEADIAAFEGVVLKFGMLGNCALTRLYSEYYREPLPGNCTVKDVQERLKQLLIKFDVSSCDVLPNDKVTVFGVGPDEEDLKLIKYEEVDDPKDLEAILSSVDFPYTQAAIWMPEPKSFVYLQRKKESMH